MFSIYVTGRELDQLAVRSGQYFVWRFLTRDGWWRGHPFSISSAPNGSWLRITIKELGDWSALSCSASRSAPVSSSRGRTAILTGARRTRQRVLLIAGGIGITPLRALLEALPAKPGDLTLLYRVRHEHDIVFRDELEALARIRGARGRSTCRGAAGRPPGRLDPLGPAGLQALVPGRPRSGRLRVRAGADDAACRIVAAPAGPASAAGPRRTVRLLIGGDPVGPFRILEELIRQTDRHDSPRASRRHPATAAAASRRSSMTEPDQIEFHEHVGATRWRRRRAGRSAARSRCGSGSWPDPPSCS